MSLRPVRGYRGMVAAGHPLAAEEGLAVLRAGGNAVDAAIAAAATLAVVSPHECGLGGDLFALIHDARQRRTFGLNASGKSPRGATHARYAAGIPAAGPLSVSVPGMVGGWQAALARFGSRSLDSLLGAAIHYADDGFPVYEALVENAGERKERIFADASCKALFFPDGRPLRCGERLRQPAAGRTLRAIARGGADAFYRGALARTLADHVRSAGGLLAAEDLAAFEPRWQEPLEVPFGAHQVCTMPPNSWGAALLLQLVAIEREGPAREEADFLLQGIRARRLAYSTLAGAIADPDVVGDEAARRIAQFRQGGALRAAPSVNANAGTDTSQVLAVDAQGNAVSLLQSVFSPFGAGLLCPETGVLLNNRMYGFATDPSNPNCVGPAKRPAQTLTPVLACKAGEAALLCATPGGPGQTGTLAQFLVRTLLRGEGPAEAIAAPRWSMTLDGQFILEDSAAEAVRQAVLAAEPAIKVTRRGAVNFGSVAALVREGEGWLGCADSRRNATASAF